MGWALRCAALLVGAVSVAVGLWPLGVLCIIYVGATLRSRKSTRMSASRGPALETRYLLAAPLLLLSAAAFLSGGTFSPLVFLAAGIFVLSRPTLTFRRPSTAVPVKDSVLLRSKRLPFVWHALAEVKPGAEAFPRALSSFTGTLLVYPATGRAYSLATSYALSQGVAEAKLLPQFRSPLHGAYLFPLDGKSAADTLRRKLSPLRLPQGDLTQSVPRASGLIVLECDEGVVHRAASFESAREAAFPTLPPRGAAASSRPLLWEVLDAMGRTTHWPDPDAFSSLLASVSATKGEPLGERLRALEGSEDNVNVESLTGDSLVLSRPQLRAMFAIYS